jgi:ATP-dependent Clp protease adaptor protein ClpS
MSRKGPGPGEGGTDTVTKVQPKVQQKLQRPKLYKVLLHNDDYTTMEFVVDILKSIFAHTETTATAIMLNIHRTGVGVAGVYTYQIAETKVSEVMQAAEEAEFPLLSTLEPDDDREEDGGDTSGGGGS